MTWEKFKHKFIGDKAFMKAALVVAVPLMLQQLITGSVNLIDNLMVGQLGDYAIGGVAAVNRYYMIATFGTNGLVAAASIFIAQYYGANDPQHMKQSFRFAIDSAMIVMIVFSFLGAFFPSVIVGFFTNDPNVIEFGVNYLRVAALSFLPYGISLAISNSIRSVGETKIPFYISAIAVVVNTILNYCFIFGKFGFPNMGVVGAALATYIARIVELILYLVALKLGDYQFKTRVFDLLKMSRHLIERILVKAAPLALNEVLWSFGMAMLYKFYATRGPEVLSGYSIASTVGDLFFILFGGMAAATTVLVAQKLGAGELDKAKDNAYKLLGFSVILSFFFGVMMFLTSFIVPYLYSKVSMEAKYTAVTFLQIQACLFWIYMIVTQCYFILRAGGDMKHTLILDSVFMWTINIPLVAIITYYTNLPIFVLYLIGQSTDVVKMFLAFHLIKKEKWVNNLTTVKD